MKRSRALRPLSSDHHQALLVAFQLKQGLAGHPESAGAPKDLAGLMALARRFEEGVFRPHARAEEDLLSRYLTSNDTRRLKSEHAELTRLVETARGARDGDARVHLAGFADLLERHVRWEERELFAFAESNVDEAALAVIGGEIEKRLVLAQSEAKSARR
jgi:hemerythrin-like domain-containing protein